MKRYIAILTMVLAVAACKKQGPFEAPTGIGETLTAHIGGPESKVSFDASTGKFAWSEVLGYIVAQMLGGFCGALLVWLYYKDHYDATPDGDTKLGTFCTMPAIPNRARNFFCEFVGTWLLVFVILMFATKENTPAVGMGSLGAFPVTALIMAIGMSLGGTTGYAINPARDFGPRCVHALVPMKGKRDSGWSYSWIPVLAPLCGAAFAALTFILLF